MSKILLEYMLKRRGPRQDPWEWRKEDEIHVKGLLEQTFIGSSR